MDNWQETVSHWFGRTADTIAAALGSWLGHRVEALVAAAVILIVSFVLAQYFARTIDMPYRQMSGAKLKHVDDAKKRLARLKRLRAHRMRFIALLTRSFVILVMLAFVIPSAVLAAGIYYYGWFIPNGEALAQETGCHFWSATHPTIAMLSEFIVSQFSMGFGYSLDILTSNSRHLSAATALSPGNPGVGIALIVYRYFVAGFSGVAVRFLWRIAYLSRAILPEAAALAALH